MKHRSLGQLMPIKDELEAKLRKGQRVSIEELATEVENVSTAKDPLTAAYSVITFVRHRLALAGIAIVPLPGRNYGIPKTEEEVIYAMDKYRRQAQLITQNALVLRKYATSHKILPTVFSEQTIKLPKFANVE